MMYHTIEQLALHIANQYIANPPHAFGDFKAVILRDFIMDRKLYWKYNPLFKRYIATMKPDIARLDSAVETLNLFGYPKALSMIDWDNCSQEEIKQLITDPTELYEYTAYRLTEASLKTIYARCDKYDNGELKCDEHLIRETHRYFRDGDYLFI